MHAMMSAEQILEHARAAEAAGAHRFCMVTQGRASPSGTSRTCSRVPGWWRSTRTSSAARRSGTCRAIAPTRSRTPGSSGCTTTWRPPRATTRRCPAPSATRAGSGRSTRSATPGSRPAWAASSTSGSRASSAWRWPSSSRRSNPTSVPINLLNPRPGTKFGDRELMDPMEVVQWVAIFRLVIPDALFRLCGGPREPGHRRPAAACRQGGPEWRDDGQLPHDARLRARMGPRGVRGARPERGKAGGQRREPAAGQSLRLARGRGPETPIDELVDSQAEANFWDPATQLRHRPKRSVPPRPDGAANRGRDPRAAHRGVARARAGGSEGRRLNDVEERLDELRDRGLYRRMRVVSGPQGPRVLLDGRPVLLLCSNNYLGLADHPRVREAAAEAACATAPARVRRGSCPAT